MDERTDTPNRRRTLAGLVPALFLALTVVMLAASILRSPPAARSDDEFRIDPAGGAQLGEWMNLSAAGLQLQGGEIRETFGVFSYALAAAPTVPVLVLELHQRDVLTAPARRTERFSLRVVRGAAPEPLLDAIQQRLRDHAASFHWIEAGPPRSPGAALLDRVASLKVPVAWWLLTVDIDLRELVGALPRALLRAPRAIVKHARRRCRYLHCLACVCLQHPRRWVRVTCLNRPAFRRGSRGRRRLHLRRRARVPALVPMVELSGCTCMPAALRQLHRARRCHCTIRRVLERGRGALRHAGRRMLGSGGQHLPGHRRSDGTQP